MQPEIIIPVISSLTAVTIAVLSIVFNYRNQKKASFELERLRMALELEKRKREYALKDSDDKIDAIILILECVQKIKDSVYTFLSSVRPDEKRNLKSSKSVLSSIQEYRALYGKIYAKVENYERKLLHDLKNDFFGIAKALEEKDHHQITYLIDRLSKERLSRLQQVLVNRKVIYEKRRNFIIKVLGVN